MSCATSLLLWYFGVVIILKVITFKKHFTELFDKSLAASYSGMHNQVSY